MRLQNSVSTAVINVPRRGPRRESKPWDNFRAVDELRTIMSDHCELFQSLLKGLGHLLLLVGK